MGTCVTFSVSSVIFGFWQKERGKSVLGGDGGVRVVTVSHSPLVS